MAYRLSSPESESTARSPDGSPGTWEIPHVLWKQYRERDQEADGTACGKSERSIVPMKAGKASHADPVEGRGQWFMDWRRVT